MLDKIKAWSFMGESGTNWFIFLGVFLAMMVVWKGILAKLKTTV